MHGHESCMKSGKYLTAGTCSGSRETYSQRHDTESRREGKNIKRREGKHRTDTQRKGEIGRVGIDVDVYVY